MSSSSEKLRAAMRERSAMRKELLKRTLGVSEGTSLAEALGNTHTSNQISKKTPSHSTVYKIGPTTDNPDQFARSIGHDNKPASENKYLNKHRLSAEGLEEIKRLKSNRSQRSPSNGSGNISSGSISKKDDVKYSNRLDQSKNTSSDNIEENDEAEKELQEFRDSTAFLKGTQSLNPHNDYSQHFVDTGQRPQNFIRDVGLADRFEEYPKLRELIRLKNELVARTAHPPMYLKCDLETFDLKSLKHQFDVILIEPPLEEYARTCGATNIKFWDWDKIMALDIGELAAQRSFVFLWCGSSDGLDLGRLCLQTWGFRRCEDLCWIKTNHASAQRNQATISHQVMEPNAVLQRTKEHCLMGIKGTVRRSTDGDFIHANVDIDLIIADEAEQGSLDKPEEMFHIIEHFCLGRRRLQLFGRDSTVRPGWLTLGPDLTMSNYDASLYNSYFADGNMTTGCTDRIESLRPKSPPPKAGGRGRGGRGRGRGGRGDMRGAHRGAM